MSFKSNISVMCVLLAVISFNVNAASVSYYQGSVLSDIGSGTDRGGLRLWVNSNEVPHFGYQDASVNTTVGVDTDSNEIWYESYDYYADGLTTSFTDAFTSGFGEVTNITTTINLNSVQSRLISPTDRQALTPTLDGQFRIESDTLYGSGTTKVIYSPIEISGSYTISGPTETVVGEFSFIPELSFKRIGYTVLDTLSYPESLILIGDPSFLSTQGMSGSLFSGMIDGVDYTASIYSLDLAEPQTSFGPAMMSLTPSIVPIPAAVWLFGSGLIGLIGLARRKS